MREEAIYAPKNRRLKRFGSMTGMIFENGGSAEIILDNNEIGRIMEALDELALECKCKDNRYFKALKIVQNKIRSGRRIRIILEPVIAKHEVKFYPVDKIITPK